MKKMRIKVTAAVCAIMMLSGTICAFAGESEAAKEESPEVRQTVPKFTMSLEQAYKQLEKSPEWTMMLVENQEDQLAVRKYMESISSAKKDGDEIVRDSTELKKLRLSRNYANEVLEPNAAARKNALRLKVYEQYFTMKNSETQLTIAKESLDIKKKLYEIAKTQNSVGKISKNEMEATGISVTDAQNNYNEALDKLKLNKMSLNNLLGYALNQDITLTDSITESQMPDMTEDEAVKVALEKRLETKTAAYKVASAEVNLPDYKAYPKNSAAYLTAKLAVERAEAEELSVPYLIELDVREKYMTVKSEYAKVQADKVNVENLTTGLTIQQTKYTAGMCTITDVNQKAVELYNAKLQQANDLLNYQLAVERFNLSIGTGVDAVSL